MLLSDKEIEAIATLACKRVFGDAYNARGLSERAMIFSIREAVRLTAERCAEICLDRFPYWPSPQPAAVCPFCEQEIEAPEVDWHYACTECAAAIRERVKAHGQ